MQAPGSMDITPTQPMLGRVWRAVWALDASSKIAIACLIVGWFFISTLVVSFGSLQHGVRFFDMSAVIADPTRLFFGIDGSVQRVLFGLICIGCLAAPLLPQIVNRRAAWCGYLAPLVLMVLCGAVLFSKTSGEFFSTPSNAGTVTGSFIRFANDLVNRGGGLVAKHISVGAGGYLALAASVFLAVHGLRRFRQRT
jgi:hypothetical protein